MFTWVALDVDLTQGQSIVKESDMPEPWGESLFTQAAWVCWDVAAGADSYVSFLL